MDNDSNVGVSRINGDPNFNFLSKFTEEIDEDNLFNNHNNFSPYNEATFDSRYIDIHQLPDVINKNNLLICTINIQSLPAKFNELCEWLVTLATYHTTPDIICLQEIWQIPDPSLFSLPNYHPLIFESRSSSHGGGVGIYIKKTTI